MQSTDPQYTVFISHAGEDKATIAIPLHEKLREKGITAFVDELNMPPGTDAKRAMVQAMETATVAVIVLSPEFIARKWPMKEMMHYLKRREECMRAGREPPIIIPCFYRLGIGELYDEPRLDRIDKDGKLLYEKSRFHERQANLEPEASIAGIKAALQTVHGIMGVRNDFNATNESSFLMGQRRAKMLETLCEAVCLAAPVTAVRQSVREEKRDQELDTFHSHFDLPHDVSELVFDFDRRDANDKRYTQEGQILEMLLDRCENENREIAVWGMAGVGKTSFLAGIRNLNIVRERFRDGLYYLPMGRDATHGELKERLTDAVRKSGGAEKAYQIRSASDRGKMMAMFREWFAGKQCLFVVDDVWKTEKISGTIIHDIATLHRSGRDSKVLLTARSPEIAAKAKNRFRLQARKPLADESRGILYRYSGLEPGAPRGRHKDDNEAVDAILERCEGLPLFLAVAGRAVKTLKLRTGHSGCLAYWSYAEKLQASMANMVTTDIDSYEGLHARLMISIELLEERRSKFGFVVNLSVAAMHRRLSVMKKQSKVPMSMLMHLWKVENESEAASVAKELEQVGLADVEFAKRERGKVELLRLHDSVYDFAVHEANIHNENGIGHKALVEGYGAALERGAEGFPEWFSTAMKADDYIHRNICRHLVACGYVREVTELLLKPQWAERQLQVSGMAFLEADYGMGIESIRAEVRSEGNHGTEVLAEALKLIREAMSLSAGIIMKNMVELWFQLHGRLHGHRNRNRLIREYVEWIECEAPRPLLLSVNRFHEEPGGPNIRISSAGERVIGFTSLQDGDHVMCAFINGRVGIVSIRRSEVIRQWQAHDGTIAAIAVSSDGTRAVTGSSDGTVKVWSTQSGECTGGFSCHFGGVKDVAIGHDGAVVASCFVAGEFYVQDTETGGRMMSMINIDGGAYSAAFIEEGRKVVTGGGDGILRVWDIATGVEVGRFKGHNGAVRRVVVSRNEKRLVSSAEDHTVIAWDLESRRQIGEKQDRLNGSLEFLTVSADGCQALYDYMGVLVSGWDLDSGFLFCELTVAQSSRLAGVDFLSGSGSIVSCTHEGDLRVWDVTRRIGELIEQEVELVSEEELVSAASFTPDGKLLVTGMHMDHTIRFWDVETGELVRGRLRGHTARVTDLEVTSDGRIIVSVSRDRTVRVWDLEEKRLLHTLHGHNFPITCVALTPNGEYGITGADDGTVRMWDLKSTDGAHFIVEAGPPEVTAAHMGRMFVRRVLVSDDGGRIIWKTADGCVSVWEMHTKKLIRQIQTEAQEYRGQEARAIRARETRAHMLEMAREGDFREIVRVKNLRQICSGEGSNERVLGTFLEDIVDMGLSPNGKAMYAILRGRKLVILKVGLSL